MPKVVLGIMLGCYLISCSTASLGAGERFRSHPPLRQAPVAAKRPLAGTPAYFVDSQRGDDENNGSPKSPWKTLPHALARIRAGDTLYLRAGVYPSAYISSVGAKNAPITIRSYPGEQAILDGGLREFFVVPKDSWVPYKQGGPGEFRSKRRYPNLRNVVGSFGDSMIGLQTYYHAQDFRATNEIVDWQDWNNRDKTDLKPLYVGPGLWYNRDTDYIHVRLAHTHLPKPAPNYTGETDPRKLPLVIASFRAVPLHLDEAKHLRLQDLIIRGAGYAAVQMDQAFDITMDNVTIWCGTYGIRSMGTRQFRFLNSALFGNVAPWTYRNDGSKRDYPGRPHRNISRFNTHALLDINAGRESSVYATPYNDHWEIAHSHFADAHDGLYLGAINVRFHHNLLENFHDDGIYLSPMYFRHRLEKTDPRIDIYQNVFRKMLTALAFGGPQPKTRDTVFVYRNIFDLRSPVPTGRPTAKRSVAGYSKGRLLGDHGSPPWSAMRIYHNTVVMAEPSRYAGMGTLGHTAAKHPRTVFNNIFLHVTRLPSLYAPNPEGNVVSDGNLYWSPNAVAKTQANFFKRFRASVHYEGSKKLYASGSTTNSIVADPRFRKVNQTGVNDYCLSKTSPAANVGVDVPRDWPDPLRGKDAGRPDVGAIPLGGASLLAGRVLP